MRDLALDPNTGDLLLVNGRTRLTTTTKGENVRQRLKIRLSLWRGEYQLDRSKGIPYQRALGRKDDGALLETYLRGAAASCPGVDHLRSFRLTSVARRGTCSFVAVTKSGEPVSVDDFQVTP